MRNPPVFKSFKKRLIRDFFVSLAIIFILFDFRTINERKCERFCVEHQFL